MVIRQDFKRKNPVPNKTEKTVSALFTLPLALLAFFAAAPVFTAAPTPAQAETRSFTIAATVNDDVVTKEDVENRLALYLAGNPRKPPPAVRVKMEKQVLDKLIDEKLQLQEARNLGIVIDKAQIDGGFANIAEQNHLTADQFKEKLKETGVSLGTLRDQIHAEIAWSQVVRRKLGPQVNVSESDINTAVSMIDKNKGKPVYQVAEILLTVPGAAHESEVRHGAEKLIDQIKHGAPFSAVARQFSQAPGAGNGGDLGWVQEGQLEPKLDAALHKMHPGQISNPIRTEKGYDILFLRNIRIVGETVNGKKPSADEDAAAAQDGTGDAAQDAPKDKTQDAPKDDAQNDNKSDSKDGGTDDTQDAAKKPSKEDATRAALAQQIGMHRLGQMQEQYLSDLRASAFIDKRL
ncbi:MAG: rotamase [Alphaproteobacteria bacterium]|nr:rotamase [Alphaproteobacteria bacterium]